MLNNMRTNAVIIPFIYKWFLEQCRVVIVQFRQHLFHDRLAEQDGLGTDTELVTVLAYGRHLAVIQIDDLPVAPHKRLLLLLEILRVNARRGSFLRLCH